MLLLLLSFKFLAKKMICPHQRQAKGQRNKNLKSQGKHAARNLNDNRNKQLMQERFWAVGARDCPLCQLPLIGTYGKILLKLLCNDGLESVWTKRKRAAFALMCFYHQNCELMIPHTLHGKKWGYLWLVDIFACRFKKEKKARLGTHIHLLQLFVCVRKRARYLLICTFGSKEALCPSHSY